MKTDKIGANQFLWFIRNWLVIILKNQILKKQNQKNQAINQKKSAGLPFFIQILIFKENRSINWKTN
jgi:hypothetical protein